MNKFQLKIICWASITVRALCLQGNAMHAQYTCAQTIHICVTLFPPFNHSRCVLIQFHLVILPLSILDTYYKLHGSPFGKNVVMYMCNVHGKNCVNPELKTLDSAVPVILIWSPALNLLIPIYYHLIKLMGINKLIIYIWVKRHCE